MPHSETPPAWRAAFLRELARAGSVVLAAECAGIDKTSAYALRRRNPAFALSWDRALATAREALNGAVPARAVRLAPDEAVRASKSGKVCVVRAGPGRWSRRAEELFLAHLAASANIRGSAEVAGFSTTAVYKRRRDWPEFARAWREALTEGYDRVEAHLLCAASAALDPEPAEMPSGPVEVSFDQGLNLLRLHQGEVRGGRAQRHDWRAQEPDIEAVRAEVLRKLAAMERAANREK